MELLSPAGSFEKLKYAINYGADAVYASGTSFGLRAQATNLDFEELKQAVDFVHSRNKRIFITLNIYGHNYHILELPPYIKFLYEIGVDAVIVSDPGIFSVVREVAPNLDIHISTQANVTSWKAAEFWYKLGAKRVILARELTIHEIKEIKQNVPELELEIFVHGAMCMSYSGRCMLSAFLNKRSANTGFCTQPCRWKYYLTEEQRPGELFPIEEDQYGTYILNSKDLCLFKRLEEILEAGIDSVKIEGRMKSLYYVANVTRAYRVEIERIKSGQKKNEAIFDELFKISHRKYTEAFFDDFDSMETQYHESSAYERDYQFIGEMIGYNDGYAEINIRAKFEVGDEIELISPQIKKDLKIKVTEIFDENNNPIEFTKPNTIVKIPLENKFEEFGIVRKRLK